MTPHIERVAKALLAAWDRAQAPDDMLVVADRIDDLRAALSATLEPSEEEIVMALRAFEGPYGHQYFGATDTGRMRAALIAAAWVRVGE